MSLIPSLINIPVIGGQAFQTQGKSWFVCPYSGSDNNSGLNINQPLKTLTQAQALATASQNDVVYLVAENATTSSLTTDYQTVLLEWKKDMVHLVGIGTGTMINSRSRISNKAAGCVLPSLMTVSGNGCIFSNISVFYGSTSTAALVALTVSGSRNLFYNCTIQGVGNTLQNQSGACDLSLTGSENTFRQCIIGLDTVQRTANTRGIILSGGGARNIFKDCEIIALAGHADYRFVQRGTNGSDRFVIFDNCDFINSSTYSGGVAMTEAFDMAANAGTPGSVYIVKNGSLVGATLWETSSGASTNLVMVGVAKLATQTGMIGFPTA